MINLIQSPFDVWRQNNFKLKRDYTSKKNDFVEQLIPQVAVELNIYDTLKILESRFGTDALLFALNPINTVHSPVAQNSNGDWIKSVNMVGINVRTIGNFFSIIKYLLTLSKAQNSIHILPIWEPGVVSSLYGKISWNINPEFFSHELASAIPYLNTVEKQLKVVVNFIHLMGKTVGLDIIPHTDRFSEMVFLYPQFFEWIQRDDHKINSVTTQNAENVKEIILNYLRKNGSANGWFLPFNDHSFFDYHHNGFSEEQRLEILFGHKNDNGKRLWRRLELMQEILHQGYETLPVTMAPPYRGIHLVENDFIYDERGNKWFNYHFDKPQAMSRIFGPLTRYKFYFSKEEESQNYDFDRPNVDAWDYVGRKYYDCQKEFNFDFMRGDMAHVQPRENGVPENTIAFYDPLQGIKNYISERGVPYFAFFAETFLAPPNEMGYGVEEDHLERIQSEATLGDLQASVVGSEDFMQKLVAYLNLLETRGFAPNFTMITADKDDPRFDIFYKKGNHLRFFVGLFLKIMPSYMSLGFECRNLHLTRGKNEEYTKLYVFQIRDNKDVDKVSHGPFIWGVNYDQFNAFEKIKNLSEELFDYLEENDFVWIKKPALDQFEMAWHIGKYTFVANLNPEKNINTDYTKHGEMVYTSLDYTDSHECRVYKLS